MKVLDITQELRNKASVATLKRVTGAIRYKCLDCSGGSQKEVDCCPIIDCFLWPFRYGKNPFRLRKNDRDKEIVETLKKKKLLQE